MKKILIFVILIVQALASPRIFGEDGVIHKTAQKVHEAGQKVAENVQDTIHKAKVKVTHDIIELEAKVHSTVEKILKKGESGLVEKNDEDSKSREAENEDVGDDDNKKNMTVVVNKDQDNTLHSIQPDNVLKHKPNEKGTLETDIDNFDKSFVDDKTTNLFGINDHIKPLDDKHKSNDKVGSYGNNNHHQSGDNDDGTDHFRVVFDQNGKAIVTPIVDNHSTYRNSGVSRHDISENHLNDLGGSPVNEKIFTQRHLEYQPVPKFKKPVDVHVDERVAQGRNAPRTDEDAKNHIDVRHD